MAIDTTFAYFNSDLQQERGVHGHTGSKDHVASLRGPFSRDDGFEEGSSGLSYGVSSSGVCAPIMDYEIVQKRETFTVYKIQVITRCRNWFIFRRYSDFTRLNEKLRKKFPCFRVILPRKRILWNNYDAEFLLRRCQGLQLFLNTLLQHDLVCQSDLVEEFLCLNDPPGPYDSLEESRAFCQQLEETVAHLRTKVRELESELSATKSSLCNARVQQEVLKAKLREGGSPDRVLMGNSYDYEPPLPSRSLEEVGNEKGPILEYEESSKAQNIGRWSTR